MSYGTYQTTNNKIIYYPCKAVPSNIHGSDVTQIACTNLPFAPPAPLNDYKYSCVCEDSIGILDKSCSSYLKEEECK